VLEPLLALHPHFGAAIDRTAAWLPMRIARRRLHGRASEIHCSDNVPIVHFDQTVVDTGADAADVHKHPSRLFTVDDLFRSAGGDQGVGSAPARDFHQPATTPESHRVMSIALPGRIVTDDQRTGWLVRSLAGFRDERTASETRKPWRNMISRSA